MLLLTVALLGRIKRLRVLFISLAVRNLLNVFSSFQLFDVLVFDVS